MSLRLRIVLAITVVLGFGSILGLALAGWHARQWLRDELTGAQAGGELTVTRAYEDLPRSDQPVRSLTRLVAAFDGDRHQQALLIDASGRVLAASRPAAAPSPPAWFGVLLRTDVPPVRLTPPGPGLPAVELRPVYANDMDAVWAEFVDLGLVLAVSCLTGGALVWFAVGRALRPLQAVGGVLRRIGAGDYAAAAPEQGPPEIASLGRGVNDMARRLGDMRARTRALEEQILTLQDEERADIARDLHDEIGPHLFAANVDAAMVISLIGAGRTEPALAQVRAIQGAIAHMQRLVRDILGRLRPTRLVELGLGAAITDLVEFWRARRPDVRFVVALPAEEADLPDAVQETTYRLVQESLSNAMRHGQPTSVEVSVERGADGLAVQVTNDGAVVRPGAPGFGLTGMRERVAQAGGRVEAGPRPAGGWRVAALLPLSDEAEAA